MSCSPSFVLFIRPPVIFTFPSGKRNIEAPAIVDDCFADLTHCYDNDTFRYTILMFTYLILLITDEDKVGPIALAAMLGFAIVVNFGVNLFDISTKASR